MNSAADSAAPSSPNTEIIKIEDQNQATVVGLLVVGYDAADADAGADAAPRCWC